MRTLVGAAEPPERPAVARYATVTPLGSTTSVVWSPLLVDTPVTTTTTVGCGPWRVRDLSRLGGEFNQ